LHSATKVGNAHVLEADRQELRLPYCQIRRIVVARDSDDTNQRAPDAIRGVRSGRGRTLWNIARHLFR